MTELPIRRVIVLIAAVGFLAGAIGYWIGHPGTASADSVDVGFYQDMISHHEQAQQLALMEITGGSDTTVMSFARELLLFQSYEIGLMEQRLVDAGHSRGDRPDMAMEWMGMGVPVEQMPGLATPDQMQQMRATKGHAADAVFLQLMRDHHVGGIHMAEYAAEHADKEPTRTLAARIAHGQAIEVNEYAALAAKLGVPGVERFPGEVPPGP